MHECEECGKEFLVREALAGHRGTCPEHPLGNLQEGQR